MKQRTIRREASIRGKALHTGQDVTLTIHPAPEDSGIIFRRIDLYGKPEVRPTVEMVTELVRNTTVSSDHLKLHTIEHVLAAFSGLGIDNAIVELDASEPPIMDGSARPFVLLIQEAGVVEQLKERFVYAIKEPVTIVDGNRSIIALPHDGFRITCTSTDDRGVHTQHLTLDIDPEVFQAHIAAARTFTIYEDIEALLQKGLIQGGSLDSAIVIKGDKIMSKEPLRFKDEFVRHKILDIIGDITLIGAPIKGHIIAVRTGHALNAKLSAAVRKQWKESENPKPKKAPESEATPRPAKTDGTTMNIRQVMNSLPHRYPFVMIDRVVEFIGDDALVAVKNVTINEPYFQGHFPGHPVMPGVLQLEAMAQASGLLMLRRLKDDGNRVCFFMSADKVKFRKAVTPGDRLHIHAKLVKIRGSKIATAECECKVDGDVVSSAEVMFTIVDAPEEN